MDNRAEAAAQCLSSSMSHHILVRSGRHKIFWVDTRSGITQQVADLASERKNLNFKHENISLSLISDKIMYAIWRRGDNELRLSKLFPGDKFQGPSSTDLVEHYAFLVNQ